MVEIRHFPEASVVRVIQPLDFHAVGFLEETLDLIGRREQLVVLDLARCESIDAACLAVIFCKSREMRLKLIVPAVSYVRGTIALAGFMPELQVFESFNLAIART